MAVTPATLKISIRETITLNNNKYDSFNNHTIPDIKEISKRILNVPTSSQEIVSISGSLGPGAYITNEVQYMRFSNLDTTNHVDLTFKNSDSDEFKIKVGSGQTFLYPGVPLTGVSASFTASGSKAVTDNMGSLTKVIAAASGSTVDMELFIASK